MTMQKHADAIIRRTQGMLSAELHANAVQNNWSDLAYDALARFCLALDTPDRTFLAEDVRQFAEDEHLETAEARAWGAIFRSAVRNGLIEKAGFAPAKSSNLSPKILWRVA